MVFKNANIFTEDFQFVRGGFTVENGRFGKVFEGDCDCKSSLTAALFLNLGYKVIFMISEKLKHAAIGVECKDTDWLSQIHAPNIDAVTLNHNGTLYLYCETTGDGYHVGPIKEGESMHDFETILELAL